MAEFLYIHIPFCVRKCAYCDFVSVPFREDLAGRYVKALCAELIMRKETAGELKTVYIGGGTPSLLAPGMFEELFACLGDNYSISPSAEITVEANPGTVSADNLRHLHHLNVNRISLGVQSFHDSDLALLGRIHSAGEAAQAIALVFSAGIRNISLDLMYGIPGQTVDAWRANLSRAAGLDVPHVSAYELTPEPGTPLHQRIGRKLTEMPEEAEILGMFDAAAEVLAGAGLGQYEISNYARPGFRCLHNLNYWDRGEYLAAGAAAHSFINGVRSRNISNVMNYIEGAESSALPVEECNSPDREESLRETIFLGLRKTEGLSTQDSPEAALMARHCGDLVGEGYLELSGGAIRLSRRGMAISNEILVQIFRRLGL